MVEVKKITKFCEDYLKVKDFEDYCHNGLQVEGQKNIKRIISGVTLSRQLIETAVVKKAEMILVHHGFFVSDMRGPLQLKGVFKDRVKLLLENNINLVGFHLPLDAHSVIGNNASLCKMLGVKKIKPFIVGFVGELDRVMSLKDFTVLVNKKLDTASMVVFGGNKKVKKVAVVSGGSSSDFEKAKEAGADVLLCGDIKEDVVRKAEEVGINIVGAGHYNTEKLGVENLGKLITKKFGIKHEFVDIPCDI